MKPTASIAGLRLLLVEDEALVAMMLEDQLADLGCVVVGVAANVAEGLAVIEDHAPELDGAVLDINLGGEKVYPVAEELAGRGIPFIFSTGYGRAGIEPDFAQTPMLAKPYGQGALAQMLSDVVGRPATPGGAGSS